MLDSWEVSWVYVLGCHISGRYALPGHLLFSWQSKTRRRIAAFRVSFESYLNLEQSRQVKYSTFFSTCAAAGGGRGKAILGCARWRDTLLILI